MADNDDRFNRGTERNVNTEGMHRMHDERRKGPNWTRLLSDGSS